MSTISIPMEWQTAFQYATLTITCIGTIANILVITGIYRSRNVRGTADFSLNINLALADLITCISWISTQAYLLTGNQLQKNSTFCSTSGFYLYFLLACSIFTLIAIALFHFRSIVWEKGLSKPLHVIIVICLIWIISIFGSLYAGGLLPAIHTEFVVQPSGLYCLCNFTSKNGFVQFFNYGIVGVLYGTPILLGLVYYSIWKKLHQHRIFVNSNRMSLSSKRPKTVNVNVMIIRRAMAVSLGFAVVFYFQSTMILYQVITSTEIAWYFDAIGACLASLNTVINPTLFLTLDIRCRKALYVMFGFIVDDELTSNEYSSRSNSTK
ncbi:hypothetical protein BC833DRAFT_590653 [Globomyces pollinis-pini]|nr:hypothetical protein BC833DRAFT_590653 [Globomyces pollinis-pini]